MPAHKRIPIESISLEEGYNVRTSKEVTANAKEVAAHMEAQGDLPEAFPIRFVRHGKSLFTRNHATLMAAKLRGWKELYAIEAPFAYGSAEDQLDLIRSNNSAHPLDRMQQGRVYIGLRDGVIDEEATAKAAKDAKTGEEVATVYKREPMEIKDIAALTQAEYSQEHIRQCIMIASSSPEVAELLENEQVSTNIVIEAARLAKDDPAKQLKILKKAIQHARADDKATATKKHLDAAKEELFPKKLIADAPVDPAKGGNAPESQPEAHSGAPSASAGDAGEPQDAGESEQKPLFEAEPETQPKSKTSAKKTREWGIALILKIDEEDLQLSMSDEDAGKLWDRLIEEGAPI